MGDNIFVLIHHAIEFFSLWALVSTYIERLGGTKRLDPIRTEKKIYIDKGFSIKAVYLHNYLEE